jgi:hypothetical protein
MCNRFTTVTLSKDYPHVLYLSNISSPLKLGGRALYDDQPFLSDAYLSSLRDTSLEESDGDPYTQPYYNFSDEYHLFYVNSGCMPDIPCLSALIGYLKQTNC